MGLTGSNLGFFQSSRFYCLTCWKRRKKKKEKGRKEKGIEKETKGEGIKKDRRKDKKEF